MDRNRCLVAPSSEPGMQREFRCLQRGKSNGRILGSIRLGVGLEACPPACRTTPKRWEPQRVAHPTGRRRLCRSRRASARLRVPRIPASPWQLGIRKLLHPRSNRDASSPFRKAPVKGPGVSRPASLAFPRPTRRAQPAPSPPHESLCPSSTLPWAVASPSIRSSSGSALIHLPLGLFISRNGRLGKALIQMPPCPPLPEDADKIILVGHNPSRAPPSQTGPAGLRRRRVPMHEGATSDENI